MSGGETRGGDVLGGETRGGDVSVTRYPADPSREGIFGHAA